MGQDFLDSKRMILYKDDTEYSLLEVIVTLPPPKKNRSKYRLTKVLGTVF